jgi:hypothetical protein
MRFYTEISKEDFLAKVKSLLVNEDDEDDGFPWIKPAIISKDLSKVQFDWENYTSFNATSGFAMIAGLAGDCRPLDRGREVVHHEVQDEVGADVVEGAGA